MSDIDKAEELLKRFMEITDPDRSYHPEMESDLRFQIKEYFRRPVFIKDIGGRAVEVLIDDVGDVSFEWPYALERADVYFQREELVRGLREIGVIE